MHSPPTIVRHIVRPKSAEPPRSPLLKRVQSEEKLSPSYSSDKKHLCSRKHSLEVTQEEVQREQCQREVTLQSLEENVCDAPSLSRARPVEQGCLKRPVSRKLGRQESVDDLDRDKLKAKVVVKKLEEKHDSHPKPHSLGGDSESYALFRLEEREKKVYSKGLERAGHFENTTAESSSVGSLLKDTLHKQASVRASEGGTSEGAACSLAPGEHSQSLSDFKRASASSILHDSVCHIPERPTPGKGEYTEKASQAKEHLRSEKLDSKLANIDYLRKKMSLDDKDDSHCAILKPKMASNTHECLPGNPMRPMAGQQETLPASESRAFISSTHTSQMGSVSFVPLKALAGRVENGVEKPGLVAPESPVRKSPSEYKLEGRSVSCLKPIEGTLDIALLSGPHASKTELPSPEPAQSPSPGVSVAPSVPPALLGSSGKKGDPSSLREPPSASLKVNKPYLLEPRFLPPNRGLQDSLAAPGPEPKSKQDRKVTHPVARSTVTVIEGSLQQKESIPTKHQDRSPDTKLLPSPGQTTHSADPPRLCPRALLPQEETISKEKPCLEGPSEKVKSELSARRNDVHRDPCVKLCPAEAGKGSDSSKNLPSGGRTHPDFYMQTQTMEKAWACSKTNHRDGQDEVKPLAREDSVHSAALLHEKEVGRARKGTEPKPAVPAARHPPQPSGVEGDKSEKLSAVPSLQKQAPREPDRKEQALQRPGGSVPQQPPPTKELSSSAAWQPCSSPNRETGTKPAAAEPSTSLQDTPQSAAATTATTATTSAGHSDCSSHKSRPGPDPSPSKPKHPDRSPSSQKLSAGSAKSKDPAVQPFGGSLREGKGSSKDPSDTLPAILATQGKANDVLGQGEGRVTVTITLHVEGSPLEAKLKTTSGACPPETQEKHPPRQGHPGLGRPEAAGQKVLPAGEKQSPSPKHPKPPTVKDCPTLCRQTDKSPGQQAAAGDRKSDGKKGTEALYVPAPEGYKPEASPSLHHADTLLKGPERPAMGTGKGCLSESKGKGSGPQKPLAETGKPSGMKRSPSATAQSSLRSAGPPEKPLSYSASFPEAQPGARDVTAASSTPSSAKAVGATSESPAPSGRDPRKPQSGGDSRSQMTKSDSLPSFRLSNSVLESHFPDPQAPSTAGHRDRALSVSATPGEPKGREPAQPPPARKQSVAREVTRAPPAPCTDRPLPLPSEKDFVVRQRRGKESLRSSPHKKAS